MAPLVHLVVVHPVRLRLQLLVKLMCFPRIENENGLRGGAEQDGRDQRRIGAAYRLKSTQIGIDANLRESAQVGDESTKRGGIVSLFHAR